MAKAGLQLFGDKALKRTFERMGERVQRKLLRQAVSAAATPVNKAAKQNAAKESGLLKKSLGRKLVTNKRRQSVTAIIGPRRNVVGEYKGKPRKPSRYSHMVEKGFIDRSGKFVPPQPFLAPGMASTQRQAVGIMRDKLAAGVVKEAAKGRAR